MIAEALRSGDTGWRGVQAWDKKRGYRQLTHGHLKNCRLEAGQNQV